MVSSHSFVVWDYAVFGTTIVVSLGIGLYYAFAGGRQKTTSEFLVGNRRMKVLPVAISLMVSFESSIMMLGVPAEVYEYGIQYVLQLIGFLLASCLAIHVLVPLIHPLKITSAYEYLELRFKSRAVRLTGTILGMFSYTCYIGIVLFGPGVALEAVTGFPQWVSITVIAAAAVIYTSIGGLKAVIWTDVFQAVVMYTGMAAILIKGSIDAGGVSETWRIASENGRLNFFNFDPDPTVRHTFWNLLVGTLIRSFGFMFNQSTIQRISATPTVRDAKKMMFITAPAFTITLTCAAIEGIVVYAYYHTMGCDPLKSKQLSNPNQLIPFMVMDIFHSLPGMPGLFIASLFSASLSTLSSGLSSMSALLYADIIKPHVKPMSQFKATVIAKLAVVFFGCLAVGVAFLISYVGGNLVQITGTLLAAFSGPLSGLFLLGCFVPFANAKGAIMSTGISIGLTAWIAAGQFLTRVSRRWKKLPSAPIDRCLAPINATLGLSPNYMTSSSAYATWGYEVTTSGVEAGIPPAEGIAKLYTISYMWLSVIGILTVIIFGAIFSLMSGPTKPEDSNPLYLVSFVDKIMCYLPLSLRKRLRFGIDYDAAEKFHVETDNLDEFVLKTEKEGIEVTYDGHPLSRLSGGGTDDNKCAVDEEQNTLKQSADCNGYIQIKTVNEIDPVMSEVETPEVETPEAETPEAEAYKALTSEVDEKKVDEK
ncbi:sodium-coupled monocarboxylate transporter 1-like [Argopecten irradians]|uniref:sodium-coupled monocarboxylate transporter 1-like n=1 Tax=Argopecten irradians TaxID=31199 RepID=UPI00371B004A